MATKDLIIRSVKTVDGLEMLELTSPYHPEMVKAAHSLAGRWDKTAKKWLFTTDRYAALKDECTRIYGMEPGLRTSMDGVLVVNTAFEAALEYVSAIKALSPELNAEEREEVLVSLLDALA